ncbi:hypothetical protein BuS5_01289 [Desulfosarcina sp. BuS5]|uniref:DUF1015 domain-containing protein n=1 Tax=Desulfosarcina sp. BuS5 TaxID=933262 RepID=UPI000485CF13|nr:DUF1015 domain-containing protein [Desulfosarcina sp. BuS5]WDN88321.1 hypothetical protein BuS5_01289 [Desulfosarcina sp. BuS5]
MAEIIPFKGILYNTDKIGNMANVVTPPYDVISDDERDEYHKVNSYNIIRLILGKKNEHDPDKETYHAKASNYFTKWLDDGILVQDRVPAFYLTTHEFPLGNRTVTRYGLTALARLMPFDRGIILPHEKTFSKVKSERLGLLKKCHANFSSIFSLYSDKQNIILNSLKDAVSDKPPDMDFTDYKGHKHRQWRITDRDIHAYVADAMKDKKLFIADGHHRYETSLNYKEWISANNPDFNADHPANFVMMYLCSMGDPGLIILPAHRILTGLTGTELSSFKKRCDDFFDITTIPYKNNDNEKAKDNFISTLKANSAKNIIGVFMKNCPELLLLTPKPQAMEDIFSDVMPAAIRSLDVTILTNLILTRILDFDQKRMDDEELFSYTTDYSEAIDAVTPGKADITFILNPTLIKQVQQIAEMGLIMPRKSTYFFPKVITGQVLNRLTGCKIK